MSHPGKKLGLILVLKVGRKDVQNGLSLEEEILNMIGRGVFKTALFIILKCGNEVGEA